MKHGEKRQQIVAAADDLFYRQGFEYTTFADITGAVGISRGNLYHHFRTKDDILDAVIGTRLGQTRETLAAWDAGAATPVARIEAYIRSLTGNWADIRDHGCPVGTLCTELTKLDHAARADSVEIFALYRQWLKNQFQALNSLEDPDELAVQMLAWGQGVAAMGNAFKDLQYLEREVQKMCDWVRALPLRSTRENGAQTV